MDFFFYFKCFINFIMKKIFIALAVLICTLGVYGQQRSVFIELGGSFQKTQSASTALSSGPIITKEPKIIARLGYAISAHSLLGLTYNWSNEKTSHTSVYLLFDNYNWDSFSKFAFGFVLIRSYLP